MSNEFHWGGINGKSLCKAVVTDIWMVFAVMVIAYLGFGIMDSMTYTPSYTSKIVVAVYPFNKMYTLEASSEALETVTSVNEVFNSEIFRTGLKERLKESDDFYLYSRQINGTYLLMLSATCSSPEYAYHVLQTAINYYEEISSRLVGESHLDILTAPDFPTSASDDSKINKYRPLLTLVIGFAMGSFLILMYVMRKTYKTASAIRKTYRDIRYFIVNDATDKRSRTNKRKLRIVPNHEAMRKTAIELLQTLRAKNANSIFVTSAASGEGKTEIIVSLARELAGSGKSVLILETDPENSEIQDKVDLERAAADLPEKSIKVVYSNQNNTDEELYEMKKDVEREFKQAEKDADVILVEGTIWTGSREELIWKEAADTSLAICKQDKADFYAIDRMMTDLRNNNSDFLGCVLYGF